MNTKQFRWDPLCSPPVTTQKKEEDVWEDLRGGGDQVVLDGTLRVLAEEAFM
jgi:hypothetical protein